MRKSIHLPVIVLVLALAVGTSQTSAPRSNPSQSPPQQTNGAGNDQPLPTTTQTGGNATSPSNSAPENQTGQPEGGTSASDLQAQIQNALRNEPTLINDKVNVSVLDDQIDLSGSVATSKEKLTAQRIVQSYAENRKVNDRLTVSGRNPGTNPAPNAGNPAPTQNKSGAPPK